MGSLYIGDTKVISGGGGGGLFEFVELQEWDNDRYGAVQKTITYDALIIIRLDDSNATIKAWSQYNDSNSPLPNDFKYYGIMQHICYANKKIYIQGSNGYSGKVHMYIYKINYPS